MVEISRRNQDRSTRWVAIWIFAGVGMLIMQVLLGGITRLTGSGLSITEWKPIMGAVPPMNEADWLRAFEKYQHIAQFKYLNSHFTLSNFKFIFFWEWFHRLWARLIGIAFLIPFTWFLAKGYFKRWMVGPLVILFLLGALQGAVGWLMVTSGLNENDVYVSHIRLAVHFMAAMVLISYSLIFGLKLTIDPKERLVGRGLLTGALLITALICLQLVYGAFMAGLKAAASAPTWPDINGRLIPEGIFSGSSPLHNFIYNNFAIHFVHRTLAYLITTCIVIWWVAARRLGGSAALDKAKNLTLLLVIVQVLLGIFTVLSSPKATRGGFGPFEWLAQVHQLTGMLLLLAMVAVVFFLTKRPIKPMTR